MLAIVVTIDEPHPYYFGGVVAAPVFKHVASDALRYLKSTQSVREVIVLNENKSTP